MKKIERETMDIKLDRDETILWSGKPAPFEVLDPYYKPVFIRNCLIFGGIGVLLIAAYVLFCINRDDITVSPIFLAILACIPFGALVPKYLSYKNFGRFCRYYLTDKGIIAYISETQRLRLSYSGIDRFETVPQSEGTTSIRIGEAVGIPDKKNRDHAINCLYFDPNGEKVRYCVLFNLSDSDAEQVMNLIRSRKPAAA